jgi:DnaK suppressor protein
MNTKHYKQKLLAKEQELITDIARIEDEARAAGEAEVRDPMDDATTAQIVSEALELGTLASTTLVKVQDALRRIEEGTYGKCLDCDREIEPARLEAIPWAEYCLEDQEKRDQAEHVGGGATL